MTTAPNMQIARNTLQRKAYPQKHRRVFLDQSHSDWYWLNVTDDGDGFDPSASHANLSSAGPGFGLITMHERARIAGGYLEIHSAAGAGTEVDATIPYHSNGG